MPLQAICLLFETCSALLTTKGYNWAVLLKPNIAMIEPVIPAIHWQLLKDPILTKRNIELWICQLQPPVAAIAGNKWLKLHGAIQQRQSNQGILSFGGAFSNHLAALAAAGNHYGFSTLGLVRTEQLDLANPTLLQCHQHGMRLIAVSRHEYRQRSAKEFNQEIQVQYPDYLLVPEGGSNQAGALGVSQLPLAETPNGTATLLCAATASGGTLAGIIQRYPATSVLGLSVVKDASLAQKVTACLPQDQHYANWSLSQAPSAYAKVPKDLIDFCCRLKHEQQLSTEPVYTGKALQQLFSLIKNGDIDTHQRIAFFHTGGLQGLAGLHYRKILTSEQYQLLSQP